MKKSKWISIHLIIGAFALWMSWNSMDIQASNLESTEINQMMIINMNTDGYEAPDETSVVTKTYEKDEPVFVAGEINSEWYVIAYKDQSIYVKQKAISQMEINEELENELLTNQEESKQFIEEVERYRAEAVRSKIWAGVIVVLIVGIMVTGVIAVIQSEKKKKKNDKSINNFEKEEKTILLNKIHNKDIYIIDLNDSTVEENA